jgi:phenylalanyl-tRNA synthetase beta subunit
VSGISKNPALFTAVNKDTAEIYHEAIPFDQAIAQEASDRAVNLIRATDAGETLPRISAYDDHFECRFCPWRARCWQVSA